MATVDQLRTRASCILAALEGWQHLPFQGYRPQCDLASLDERTRVLEAVALPDAVLPPMVAPTWDALAWRIARLQKRVVFGSQTKVLTGHVQESFRHLLMEDDDDDAAAAPTAVSLDELERVVAAVVRGCPPTTAAPRWEPGRDRDAARDDAEHLDLLRHQVYYALGVRRCAPVTPVPTTLRELYLVAMELTLKTAHANSPAHFPEPRPLQGPAAVWSRPATGPPLPGGGFAIASTPSSRMKRRPLEKRRCTRCSRCRCRDDGSSVSSSGSDTSSIVVKDHPVRRFFKFGWLRPLACWRRKEVDSGSDTSSTMSV